MLNWSELPRYLLIEVAERINKYEDFVAFRMVCKTWAAAGRTEYFKGLWLRPGTPYLLLPANDVNDVREFYCLTDCKIVASVSILKFKNRKCYESLGWLLAVEEDGSMYLLNPFSSVEIPVPHQTTFPGYVSSTSSDAFSFVKKFVLSARPIETCDFTAMIICHDPLRLAFWRPCNESWNMIDMGHGTYSDVMYHDGHFYAIDYDGYAWVFTLHKDNLPEGQIVTRLIADVANNFHDRIKLNELVHFRNLYILKTSLSLFIITRMFTINRNAFWYNENDSRSYNTSKFQVYEVDTSTGTWAEVFDLGNMAIFVGYNSTFAIDPSRMLGNLECNHIYFSDDDWTFYHDNDSCKDVGVFNMGSRRVRPIYNCEVLPTKICPPIWITKWF